MTAKSPKHRPATPFPIRVLGRFTTSPLMPVVLVALLCIMVWGLGSTPPQVNVSVRTEVISSRQPPAVPELRVTADAGAAALDLMAAILGSLPKPGPNQIIDPKQCKAPARLINNGCWLLVGEETPPCDPPEDEPRSMWPHEGRCWMPMAHAARTPTSGDASHPGGVASPP